jgi:hypothetical protein
MCADLASINTPPPGARPVPRAERRPRGGVSRTTS